MEPVTVVSFGGGLNSTAMLLGWLNAGYSQPDLILFADTGSERQETYDHVLRFSKWLEAQGWEKPTDERFKPEQGVITWTKKGGREETLEEYALRTENLPSLAYGKKSCSHKFKIEPQEREVNNYAPARQEWKAGRKVVKLIGYGAEEGKRVAKAKIEDDKYIYRFPLAEWGWDRQRCQKEILQEGLPLPPKSACFFCPATGKDGIHKLQQERPDLVDRALTIEKTAMDAGNVKHIQGLGRWYSWHSVIKAEPESDEEIQDGCIYCADDS